MLKHHAGRLARRLIVLFVLVAALAALSSNPPRQKAQIIPTCASCEYRFNVCLSNCAAFGGTLLFACHTQCGERYNDCTANCR